MNTSLVWHRGDLRVHDHAALHAAAGSGAVLGVVILDPAILDATSARRRAMFLAGVAALRASYERAGGMLLVRRGEPAAVLAELIARAGAREVHALRSHTPYGRMRDAAADDALLRAGAVMQWHDGLYVHEPGTLRTRDGRHFAVYAGFARRWSELPPAEPLPPPARLRSPPLPPDLAHGAITAETSDVALPEAGEDAAFARLERFLDHGLDAYADARDGLDGAGGSGLSIDFTLGMLSPRVAWQRVQARGGAGARKWLAELAWRDYLADVLRHRPDLIDRPYDARWEHFDWDGDDEAFAAWRDGRTGIPVVDAAMRQLAATGWIGNRARMVAAQFLAKHLRVHWTRGERQFRHWLLDGDVASNVGNWQWAAGLGLDNAPYFRVFNPVRQGREHDPDGNWLRRWVPECDGDPRPLPGAIVDLARARRAYLGAAEAIR